MKERNIFIVDDDQLTTEMLKDFLQENPLNHVETFGTGEECIQHLNKNPDIVILDYKLNRVNPNAADGMEILQEIKKIDENICVIMLSSQEHYGKALQTIVKGAMEYVVKGNDAYDKIREIVDGIHV